MTKKSIENPWIRFLLLFTGVFLVLGYLAPLAGVEHGYNGFVRGLGQAVYHSVGKEGIVEFSQMEKDEGGRDTQILFMNSRLNRLGKAQGKEVKPVKVKLNTRRIGYLPLCILLALFLAFQLTTQLKWKPILYGIILLHLFILFRLWLVVHYTFNKVEWLEVVHWGPAFAGFMENINQLFNFNIVITVLVPVLIWVMATFDGSHLNTLLKRYTY